VNDQVYEGRDVLEAVGVAAQALGVAPEALKYVVLEPGRPAGVGVSAVRARVAVLLDAPSPAPTASPEPPDAVSVARGVIGAVAERAGLEVSVEAQDAEGGALRLVLGGRDFGFFLDGGGEVLRAMEHLLQRMLGRRLFPRRLLLDAEGFQAAREEALQDRALKLAEAVRADGVPRTTEPLNAYERRLVHLALSEEPGVRTFSVGEGADRRVTVAPRDAPSQA
jgi:spoIIIJ-associated protein